MVGHVKLGLEYREISGGTVVIRSVDAYNKNGEMMRIVGVFNGKEFFGEDATAQAVRYFAELIGIDEDMVEAVRWVETSLRNEN